MQLGYSLGAVGAAADVSLTLLKARLGAKSLLMIAVSGNARWAAQLVR